MKPYFERNGITIYHGDCFEVLPHLDPEAVDVLVTDPPYGVRYRNGWANKFQDVPIANDHDTSSRDAVLVWWGERPALMFGSWKAPRPRGTKLILTWDKGTVGMGDLAMPWFPCTEEIYVLGRGFVGTRTSAVLRHVGRNTHHPTEKPLALLHELLAKCPPGGVLDPFMGSGSTLRAAMDLGRKAIGIEINEQYCEIAAKRLSQQVLL